MGEASTPALRCRYCHTAVTLRDAVAVPAPNPDAVAVWCDTCYLPLGTLGQAQRFMERRVRGR